MYAEYFANLTPKAGDGDEMQRGIPRTMDRTVAREKFIRLMIEMTADVKQRFAVLRSMNNGAVSSLFEMVRAKRGKEAKMIKIIGAVT